MLYRLWLSRVLQAIVAKEVDIDQKTLVQTDRGGLVLFRDPVSSIAVPVPKPGLLTGNVHVHWGEVKTVWHLALYGIENCLWLRCPQSGPIRIDVDKETISMPNRSEKFEAQL